MGGQKIALRANMRKRRRFIKPNSAEVFTADVIIRQMAEYGAKIIVSPGGTLRVRGLAKLPPALYTLFIDYPRPSELTAAAHLANQNNRLT
jgi:hypothetical protein